MVESRGGNRELHYYFYRIFTDCMLVKKIYVQNQVIVYKKTEKNSPFIFN